MRSARGRWIPILLACLCLAGLALPRSARAAAPAATGAWSPPFSEGGPDFLPTTAEESARYPAASNAAVTPDGRVVYWNGLEGQESVTSLYPLDAEAWARPSRSRVLAWVRGRPAWSVPTPEHGGGADMFGSDQKWLRDGRLLVAGGSRFVDEPDLGVVGFLELDGVADVRLFDPVRNRFTPAWPMHHPRKYPTLVTLPDGRLLVLGGTPRTVRNTRLTTVREPEIYDPSTDSWRRVPTGERALPLHPRVHVLPNGRVLYTAAAQWAGPAVQPTDELQAGVLAWFDPASGRWEEVGRPAYGMGRSGAFSVLLPLEPPYRRVRILVGGGTLGGASRSSWRATRLTELITVDLETGRVRAEPGPDLHAPRWMGTPVLLADGTVAVFSGADADVTAAPGLERAVRVPERLDPRTGVFQPLPPARRDRTYGNTAVLLPDGSVLVGGHTPLPLLYLRMDNAVHRAAGTASNYRDPTFEIYRPPYLFRGARPAVRWAPARVRYGERFTVGTPDAHRVRSALLVRLPAVTHGLDSDQRAVVLPLAGRGAGTLVLGAPPHGGVAPPGPYYLFLLAEGPGGSVPSQARVVWVDR